MKNKSDIHIKLGYKGTLLFETNGSNIDKPLTIGRSKESDWTIPADDKHASVHHAVIKTSHGKIMLEDIGSTNGTFYEGHKIQKMELLPGIKIKIGDAAITVESIDASKDKTEVTYHHLECLYGDDKGKMIPLSSEMFTIGAAEDNQYVCKNSLISKHHAQFRIDSTGGCWVMDTESKNGVKVNKNALPPSKERLLKDGDIISIAFLDFRFLDKSKKHVRSNWGIKLTALVVTVITAIFCYVFYSTTSANAYELMEQSRVLASEKRFTEAMAVLESAKSAREYEKFSLEIDDLGSQIKVWALADKEWSTAKNFVKNKNWVEAVRELSSMQCEKMENWNWNEEKTSEDKNLAVFLKKYIDIYLKAKSVSEKANSSVDNLQEQNAHLKTALTDTGQYGNNELLLPLFGEMQELSEKLEMNLMNHASLQQILAPLEKRAPDYKSIVARLTDLEKNSFGVVKQKVAIYLKPIKKLQKAQESLLNNAAMLTQLEFSKIQFELELPTADECSVHPYITSSRASIERIHENFKVAYEQIHHMHNKMEEWGVNPPDQHPLIQEFFNEENLEKAIQCDVLQKKIPFRTRKVPAGVYDKLLGVEYFYEVLRSIPNQYDDLVLDRMQFRPDCVTLRKFYGQLADFLTFADLPENRWLLIRGGKIKMLRDYCASQMNDREKMIDVWLKKSEASEGRTAILYGGLAIYLAPDNKISYEEKMQFANRFKKYHEPITHWDKEYDPALPEKAIEIREKILNQGIPGDWLVNKVWATKY